MIEFVGSKEIINFAKEEGFETIRMTFEDKNADGREAFNVFEISEEEFEKMDSYEDEFDIHVDSEEHPKWKDEWGWWRYAEGCNLEGRYSVANVKINNHFLTAWFDDTPIKDWFNNNLDDGDIQSVFDEGMELHANYSNLFEYCIDMWGCSTEKNVTAIAVGLAKLNNMSLADLFKMTVDN